MNCYRGFFEASTQSRKNLRGVLTYDHRKFRVTMGARRIPTEELSRSNGESGEMSADISMVDFLCETVDSATTLRASLNSPMPVAAMLGGNAVARRQTELPRVEGGRWTVRRALQELPSLI
jgi:hypothetical protein